MCGYSVLWFCTKTVLTRYWKDGMSVHYNKRLEAILFFEHTFYFSRPGNGCVCVNCAIVQNGPFIFCELFECASSDLVLVKMICHDGNIHGGFSDNLLGYYCLDVRPLRRLFHNGNIWLFKRLVSENVLSQCLFQVPSWFTAILYSFVGHSRYFHEPKFRVHSSNQQQQIFPHNWADHATLFGYQLTKKNRKHAREL